MLCSLHPSSILFEGTDMCTFVFKIAMKKLALQETITATIGLYKNGALFKRHLWIKLQHLAKSG